jgi:integrase
MKTNSRPFGSYKLQDNGKVRARYTDPRTGVRHNAMFSNVGDARAWLVEIQSDINQGRWKDTATSRSTLGEYGLQWLEQCHVKPNVREDYLSSWRVHVMPQLGSLAISDLTAERVRQWRNERLRATGAYAVKNAYAVLRIVMNVAVDENIIRNNPCNRTNKVQTPQLPKRDPLSPDQVADVAMNVSKHYAVLVLVLGWIGMRIGEACALRLSDLSLNDPDNAIVRIQRRVKRLKTQELHFDTTKTSAGNRVVSIPPQLVPVIQQHIIDAGIVDPDALVFTTNKGLCAITAAPKEITKALRKLGHSNIRTHDLRHTAATAMTNSGASLIQVMHVLGHSSVTAAMRYQHPTTAAGRDLAHQISDAIVLPDNVLPLVRKAS